MFEQLFSSSDCIEKHRNAPLEKERVRYLEHLAQSGHTSSSLCVAASQMLTAIGHMNLGNESRLSEEEISTAARDVALKRHEERIRAGLVRPARLFAYTVTDWFRFIGRLKIKAEAVDPSAKILEELADYLAAVRGLSPDTVQNRLKFARRFLDYLRRERITLKRIRSRHVEKSICDYAAEGRTRSALVSFVSNLRVLFSFFEHRGYTTCPISSTIPMPRIYSEERLVKSPSWDEVGRLLNSVRGGRRSALRDRAMLLLAVVYGLRSCEVRNLQLSDIDWERDQLRVLHTKTRVPRLYPLCASVGNAISKYIREERPKTENQTIFLTVLAPITPLTAVGFANLVRRRLAKAGIRVTRQGPHCLRHANASHLVQEGFSLKEIGDMLGHRSPRSTRTYAKRERRRRREVAEIDLGGLQ
jgi:site-specific recombinase XerD